MDETDYRSDEIVEPTYTDPKKRYNLIETSNNLPRYSKLQGEPDQIPNGGKSNKPASMKRGKKFKAAMVNGGKKFAASMVNGSKKSWAAIRKGGKKFGRACIKGCAMGGVQVAVAVATD